MKFNAQQLVKCVTSSKRILERLGVQTSSSFVKIDWSVFLNLKPIYLTLMLLGVSYIETVGFS